MYRERRGYDETCLNSYARMLKAERVSSCLIECADGGQRIRSAPYYLTSSICFPSECLLVIFVIISMPDGEQHSGARGYNHPIYGSCYLIYTPAVSYQGYRSFLQNENHRQMWNCTAQTIILLIRSYYLLFCGFLKCK